MEGISFIFDSLLFSFWSILVWFQVFIIFTTLRIFWRNFKHLRFFSILLQIKYLWFFTILILIDFVLISGFYGFYFYDLIIILLYYRKNWKNAPSPSWKYAPQNGQNVIFYQIVSITEDFLDFLAIYCSVFLAIENQKVR